MASPASRSRDLVRLSRWLAAIMVATVALALAALLAARADVATASQLRADGTPSHWQTYHYPLGLFSLRLPPGWMAQIEPATIWYLDKKVSEDMITFDNPSQGTGSANLWVVADPIRGAFAHQYYCEPGHAAYQSFVAMNASAVKHLEAMDAPWSFTTENANFQIDITIPGVTAVPGYGPPPPPATPLPATWISADQTEIQAMLASFQPTNPNPLSC